MLGTFKIGSILGITIRMHVLLLPLFILPFLWPSETILGISLGLSFALLVPVLVLHELGHCLAARRFGIEVVDITLWPLGGMARMNEMPETSRVEGLVALSGPAMNLLLALLTLPVWMAISASNGTPETLGLAVRVFFVINLFMGVFNLIPAFPTDGGRVLRAFLGRNGDWLRATEQAVFVGRVVAIALALFGIAVGDWMIPALALWLWWMSGLELRSVRQKHARGPAAVFAERTEEPARSGDWSSRAANGARRTAPIRTRGFTDADIERLEKFRGRLRQLD